MLDLIPEPAFTRCPCGALILTREWVQGTATAPAARRTLCEPMNPIAGLPHRCAEVPDARK
jgi:hypothetical protein